ncbi:MAG TPA: glycosyltransferase family 2 protein [Blastocatellia bacterium]|nr:glycosyltransferase family 2 protein [Blastocatellia bacterium]
MPTVIAALVYEGDSSRSMIKALAASSLVTGLILVGEVHDTGGSSTGNLETQTVSGDFFSGKVAAQILDSLTSDYLLVVFPGEQIEIGARAVERMFQAAEDSGAGLVYADFKDESAGTLPDHALIDYQLGSIRDTFDFGSMILISKRAANHAISKHGRIDDKLRWAGWYDLKLKLAIDSSILRIPEPLYTRVPRDRRASGERQFDYVDPRKRDYQAEMEDVVTEHLKRIDAYLTPEFQTRPVSNHQFPVRASIVIPVRNRERTIKDAVTSALSQVTSFEFNVIVIDNHSTDRTTDTLHEIALSDSRLIHLKPARTDLGIGGCWNEAIYSGHCGEYAVQLDSDDLYADPRTLATIIAKFDEGNFAMVIGSYTIVDFDLKEIPPGLIDHREWTRENGRNNALRTSGLGAPRAFYVPVLRQIGFPNASYGEDYSVALRVSRHYEIGRIYEPIYYARRWEGNSDAALPLATSNRYDAYKDHLRTVEILARQKMNGHELE